MGRNCVVFGCMNTQEKGVWLFKFTPDAIRKGSLACVPLTIGEDSTDPERLLSELSSPQLPTYHHNHLVLLYLSTMEDISDQLKSYLGSVGDQGESKLVKAIAITEYFRNLSLQIAQMIPGLLVKHVSSHSHSDDARIKELHSLMSDILCVEDSSGLLSFFRKYSMKVSSVINSFISQPYKELAEYLDKGLLKDLYLATHLDVNDLVIGLKKGVLKELAELAKKFHNELEKEDEFTNFLKTQLSRYEWVSKLTTIQNDITHYLKIGKQRSLNDSEKHNLALLMEIDKLSDDNIETVLKLLEYYGVIQCRKKGLSTNHAILTVSAANLSLQDIMEDQTYLSHPDGFKEVRFLCTECFYIDVSVYRSKSKLKNVAIMASKIIVRRESKIDVSGSDGNSYRTSSCATHGEACCTQGSGAHGNDGGHGEPGESGGNVLFCADEIENSELLILRSDGGSGENGQHGGNGQNGRAIPSESCDLSQIDSAGYEKMKLCSGIGVYNYSRKFKCYCKEVRMEGESIYGVSPGGVKILYGRGGWDLFTYAFMYSRGANGQSADGGNAGKGGKAGGEGKGGHINLFMKNGIDRNQNHDVSVSCQDGHCGLTGKPGESGKKDLVESRRDYLVMDAILRCTLRYDGFINALPYSKKKFNSKWLDRGKYCCEPGVAKCFDNNMKDGEIVFFKGERDTYCQTRYNQHAQDGKDQEQDETVIHSTPSKPINKAEVQKEYQVFSNEHLQVEDNSSLIQFLEEMQRNLHEKLDELETTYVKQQYKQVRRFDDSSESNIVRFFDADSGSISKLAFEVSESTLPSEIIAKLKSNSLTTDKDKFSNDSESMQVKYSRLVDLIEEQLADQLKRKGLPQEEVCKLVYQLMEITFHPTFLIHIDWNNSLQNILSLLDMAEKVIAPLKSDYFNFSTMKNNIKPMYVWAKLSEAHQKLLAVSTYGDNEFQRKAVAVHRKICSQSSIEDINTQFSNFFPDGELELKIAPFRKPLKPFETSCNAVLPLSSNTKTALEILMVLINEANGSSYGKFHYPDILQAIEKEYEAYYSTVSDPDLMFILTYIQDKLDLLLLDRAQLESIFCEKILSIRYELDSYKGGFIFYQDKVYQIEEVDYQRREHRVLVKSRRHNTFEISLKNGRVYLDRKLVDFPESLLVSKLDIKTIWKETETALIKSEKPFNDKTIERFLDKVSLKFPQDEYKTQFTLLLKQAHIAQDIQFDVFSFHPPSHWVEKLILSTVQKQYSDDPNFVTDLKKKIDGLSQCYDKSLYCIIYTQFLLETSQRGESFKVDLLKLLERMRSIFIEQNLCFLVTEKGITQAGIEDADYIFSDLIDREIIDSIGMFLPNITELKIELYCSYQEVEVSFFKTIFIMQKCIGQLTEEELSFWNHKLGELLLRLSLQKLTGGDTIACDKLLEHTYQMQRNYGELQVLDFVELICSLSQKDIPSDKILDLFSKCSTKEWIFSIVNFQINKRKEHLSENSGASPLLQALDDLYLFDWESQRNKECMAEEIIKCLKSGHTIHRDSEHFFSALDAVVKGIADIKEYEKNTSQLNFHMDDEFQSELSLTEICEYSENQIAVWASIFKGVNKGSSQNSYLIEAFAVIRRGITLFFESQRNTKGVVPRDTQMVASLLFFQDLSAQGRAHGTKLLQQIATGEGKTIILCMVAICKALLGEKVDIVTSSSVLATRDAAEQKPLYDLFKVTTSHCCHEDISKRRKAYDADVIYGDIGSFQRDILETNFYDRDIRTERTYDNVFVDEVDSMLVDKGQNMLYLPHALPDMNSLDQIYLEIWSLVNAKDFIGLKQEQELLYFALRHRLIGAIAPNAFTAIAGISEKQSEDYFESLIKNGIVDSNDHCLTTTNFTNIKEKVGTFVTNMYVRNDVLMIIQQHLEEKTLLRRIPKSLHPFIKKSLKSWIHSAVCAKYFRPNKEYIIDIDHRESASDRYPKIVIMDNETGVEQESSEWGSGLHQFLQLKHNLRLSTESLKAVYMSNISFFTKHYKNIMGVTGTLGSEEEHMLFKKLYEDTLIVKMPTNKQSRLIMELPLCCSTKVAWEQAVYSDVHEKLQNNRVVLLICEDVEGARYLQQFFNSKDKDLDPILYFSCHQEKLEEKAKFMSGQLIIATNLAGRGTDIKLLDKVRRNGGLHVCLSYLPPNIRVELQAYGRAARSGDPGSCKTIFFNKNGDLNFAIQKRNLSEAHRIGEIEVDYFKNIRFQEELFDKFKTLYYSYKKNKDSPGNRAQLDYCLDCWAFFMDYHTDAIESIPKKTFNEAKNEKDRILRAFKNDVEGKISGSLPSSRLIQLGHEYMKRELKRGNEFKDAGNKTDFDRAVCLYKQGKTSEDPFALYYLAAAQLNLSFHSKNTMSDKGVKERRELEHAFYKIIPLFQHKIKQCQSQATMLQLANRHQDQTMTGNTQYFQEQKQHEIEIYNQFISSMQDVTGKEITQSIFDHADWGEEGAGVIFNIVQKEFSLRSSVAKSYYGRLANLLSSNDSYFTYEAKIKERVERLTGKDVRRDDFVGVLPSKEEFWSLLKKNQLISRETKTTPNEEGATTIAQKDEVTGYWNPKINVDRVQLESWDCLDTHSFDWIEGIKEEEKVHIYSQLNNKHILSSKGQLMDLNLAKPLEISLRDSCVKYYKAIKDTLWHHAVYRFILHHLHDCAEIDVQNELTDSVASNIETTQTSIVDILLSLNPSANVSSEGEIKHILISSPIPTTSSDSERGDLIDVLRDHVPTEALNNKFIEQLTENNLKATQVSGSGLNCMINAMIQHANQDYLTLLFQEADDVRNSIKQKHPSLDLSGMLHCDDEIASEVLAYVNDKCFSKIETVSVFMASSDGPILYGGTSDRRFCSGKQVVLWQQGNHFVAVVHEKEYFGSIYQVESDQPVDFEKQVPMINRSQLKKLEMLRIVSKAKAGKKCRILKTIEEIESIIKADSLLIEEKDELIKFLKFKLEVDYTTLSNSPRVLASKQIDALYDDLCSYAVINEKKLNKTSEEIDKKCSQLKIEDSYLYKDMAHYIFGVVPYYLNMTILNQYLEPKNQKLNQCQYQKLEYFLLERDSIDYVVTHARDGNNNKAVSVINVRSTPFLTDAQRPEVRNFILLMLQLRSNASFIRSTLKNQHSSLLDLETPEITLRKLTDVFEDSIEDKGDVLGWFSDNQCDLIINLADQKWSWKSIFTALSVIAIGVVQIALGAVLLLVSAGSGSFLCNALISEGVSDMIFGIEGLVRGHCNWSQYFDHKIMSIAITVATAGIGAYFAKGTKASRYTYKAFGNASKSVAKSTAKQTGKSFGKVMAKQVGKKIAKKAAEAAVDAGINLACDKIVEEMSQSIECFSQCIVDSFDNMTGDAELTEKATLLLQKENPEKAKSYIHQIFTRVMQKRTFLEIWDDIEGKVRTGANVITQAHGSASKHLKMADGKIKGKGLMKGIGYVSRFAPLISESIKIGLVKKKMDLLKRELIKELDQHHVKEHNEEPLDDKACDEILKQEVKEMKQYLCQQTGQRCRTIVTTGLQIVGQELKKHTITWGKDITHKIKGHVDMKQLKKYEHKLLTARSEENRSTIVKYERKLNRLMSRTRNPKVFAHLIEHHNAQLGPAFAIPALEKMIGRPIKLVNEDGKPLLNVQEQHVTGEPLEIKFIPGKGIQPGHFYAGGESFSLDQHGNDCLIHAAMEGAGKRDYIASEVRQKIARACSDRDHPCHNYIKSGIAGNYVAINLIGGIHFRNYAHAYVEKRSNNAGLEDGETNICHTVSRKSIKDIIANCLKTKDGSLEDLSINLLPSIKDVRENKSAFGTSNDRYIFLQVMGNTKYKAGYEKSVQEVKEIVKSFYETGKMSNKDLNKLIIRFNSAPVNLRLGDASMNQKIQAHTDYDGKEQSKNLTKALGHCQGFVPFKTDKKGKPMNSNIDKTKIRKKNNNRKRPKN